MKVFTLIFLMFALIITMVACKDVNTDPTPTTAATTTQAPTTAGSVTTTDSTTASTATTAGTIAPSSTATSASTSTTDTTATTATTVATAPKPQLDLFEKDKFTLEPDRQELPTYAELHEKIQIGLYPSEVTELLGNPQRIINKEIRIYPDNLMSPIRRRQLYVFDSCDGDSVAVCITANFQFGGVLHVYGVSHIIDIPREG